jgi:hypothetical protein
MRIVSSRWHASVAVKLGPAAAAAERHLPVSSCSAIDRATLVQSLSAESELSLVPLLPNLHGEARISD